MKSPWREMCCMNVNCDNCLVNLEWTLIYQQRINPTKKKKVHSFGYCKSSIKPLPGVEGGGIISNTLEGGLNRDGGRI